MFTQAISAAILALAAKTALALPALSSAEVVKRDDLQTLTSAQCQYNLGAAYEWVVYMPNETQYEHIDGIDHDNCGEGFLDNFRGRCGVISGWTCTYLNPNFQTTEGTIFGGPNSAQTNPDQSTDATQNKMAYMQFWTSAFCQPGDITAAVGAATNNAYNLPCNLQADEGGDIPGADGFGGDG